MWTNVNGALRGRLPKVHGLLKRITQGWRSSANPLLPVPKWVDGQFVWVHPRLLTRDTTITQPYLIDWIARYLRPGDVFFDAGAHYGWISLKAARYVGSTGTVVAFEPSPPMAGILAYHVRANRLKRIQVVQKAVSNCDAPAVPFFLVAGGISFRNSLVTSKDASLLSSADQIEISVEATTLDTFSKRSGLVPKVIKIDIEGAEYLALQGAAGLLKEHRPVIAVDVHPYWLAGDHGQSQIFELLRSYGYREIDSRIFRGNGVEAGNYLFE